MVLLGLVFLVTACRGPQEEPEPYRSPTAEAFTERGLSLAEAVEEVLKEARRLSEAVEEAIELPDGSMTTVRRTPLHVLEGRTIGARPRSSWQPAVPDVPPAGEVLYSADSVPKALAVGDDGALFLGTDRVLRIEQDGEPEEIVEAEPSHLLWDAKGERLAIAAGGQAFLLDGTGLKDLGEVPTGTMAWDLSGEKLLFFRDHLVLEPEEVDRIFLEGARLDLETGELEETGFTALRHFAAKGTLPPAGIEWAHLRQSRQIDPVPAPLVHVENGEPMRLITQTTDAADLTPTASARGDLAWLRSHRAGAASARAYLGTIRGEKDALLLSTAPTLHVAIAPGGEWGALVTEEETGRYAVRRFRLEEVRERREDFARLQEADRRFAGHTATLGARLHEAYGLLPEVRTAEQAGEPHFAGTVSRSSLQRLARALASGLERTVGIELDGTATSLAELDAFLDFATPHLPEDDPAWLAGLGSYFGAVLEREQGAQWVLERWRGDLSAGVENDFGTDGLTYAIACPLVTARMVLAGETTFRQAHARIASREGGLPFYLAESLSEDAVDVIELLEFERAGLPPEAVRLGRLRNLMWEAEDLTPAACLFASRVGEDYGAEELRVLGAVRLAQLDPSRSGALEVLGRALAETYEMDLAARVYEVLLEFEPARVGARIEYADLLATLGRFEEASRHYSAAGYFDQAGTFEADLAERQAFVQRHGTN